MYGNCYAGLNFFFSTSPGITNSPERRSMKSAVKEKPPKGQRPKLLKPALLKSSLAPYPAAARCIVMQSRFSPFIPYCHDGAMKPHFCFLFFIPPLKKEGKCGKILLPWEPDFRLQGGTFTQARCCVPNHFSGLRFSYSQRTRFLNPNPVCLSTGSACSIAGSLRNSS